MVVCKLDIINSDIGILSAATIYDCMDGCANYLGGNCKGVVFNSNLTLTQPFGGNCWFKSSMANKQVTTQKTDAAAIVQSITES